MGRTSRALLIAAVLFVTAAGAAHADMGTPLILATFFQLFIGNLFIGVGEGLLLAWRYDTSPFRALATMIAANYVSAWAGYFVIPHANQGLINKVLSERPPSIQETIPAELVLIVGSYCLTILLEWPFCYWVIRTSKPPDHRLTSELPFGSTAVRSRQPGVAIISLRASILVNTASYLMLLPIYLWLRSIS